MVRLGEPVPAALADATVFSRDGRQLPFGELARGRTTLAVFIRHFGCIGCAEQVYTLAPRLHELAALGVRVVLVGSGPPDHIDAFMERHALADKPIEIVTDPTLGAHGAAELPRSTWATYGPRAIVDFVRAFTHGHRPRPTDGDLMQQGGTLLIDSGTLVWAHRNESLGGHADPADVMDAVLRLHLQRAPLMV